MQSITKEYLLDIVYRKMSATIQLHRKQNPSSLNMAVYHLPTKDELQEFIFSIPYFDSTLKNYLTSSSNEQTIISQTWELEFIKKCELWVKSYEWMYGKPYFLNSICHNKLHDNKTYLKLPY
jgi:hypothetical protein